MVASDVQVVCALVGLSHDYLVGFIRSDDDDGKALKCMLAEVDAAGMVPSPLPSLSLFIDNGVVPLPPHFASFHS